MVKVGAAEDGILLGLREDGMAEGTVVEGAAVYVGARLGTTVDGRTVGAAVLVKDQISLA